MLSVVHRESLSAFSEYVDFIESIPNLRFVKLNPLHAITETGETSKSSISPVEFASFVISVFSRYVEKGLYHRFPIEPCLSAIQVLSGVNTHFCNYSFRKCTNFVCLYPDGSTSLCDSLPFFELSLDSPAIHPSLHNQFNKLFQQCIDCDIADFCHGGCLGIRCLFGNSTEHLSNYCQSKRMLRDFFQSFAAPSP